MLTGIFKLGRVNQEVVFDGTLNAPEGLSITYGQIKARHTTARGQRFERVRRRADRRVKFTITSLTEDKLEELASLRTISDDVLSFVYANAQREISDRYTLEAVTPLGGTFKLAETPMTSHAMRYAQAGGPAQVAILGVFSDYNKSGGQVSTNWFTGGTYAPLTRTVTLGTNPGPVGTVIYCNWTYNGMMVVLDDIDTDAQPGHVTSVQLYEATVGLEGA
jgi:hypothetical protein